MFKGLKLAAGFAITAMLVACGGGGDGTSVSNVPSVVDINIPSVGQTYAIATPTKLTAIPAMGPPSFATPVTDYGVATVSIAASSATDLYGGIATYDAVTSSPFQMYSTVHLDGSVIDAWNNGWNGLGVTISIIDDFNTAAINLTRQTPTIIRTADYDNGNTYGKVRATHSMVYEWATQFSHGSLVSNIAGGDYDGQSLTSTVTATVASDTKTACTTLRAGTFIGGYTQTCGPSYYVQTNGSSIRTIDLNYKKVAGVAKRANVVNNNVNLSSSQNPIQTVADVQGHLQNSAYLGVINLSLGSNIPTSGKTFDQVMAEVAKFPLASFNAVVAVAAGNGGAACATQDLNGCNAVAIAMAYQTATRNSTIVVGALSGSGSSENIATYSARAGVLASRFVLASGEEGDKNVQGTSFAAPRVAGIAAILKHKYPALTAAQIANVILLSASKDINNDGIDDFVGVSPIYGHGKVSLTRALTLAGAI